MAHQWHTNVTPPCTHRGAALGSGFDGELSVTRSVIAPLWRRRQRRGAPARRRRPETVGLLLLTLVLAVAASTARDRRQHTVQQIARRVGLRDR
jgi:hypothetical protein